MNTIQERMTQYLESKGITPYRFCKDLNLSMGYLDKRGAIGTDKYLKIIEYYSEINPQWLLTGKGEMLRKNNFSEEIRFLNEPNPEKYGNTFNEKDKIIEALANSLKDKEEILSLLREKTIRQENEILELKKK